VWRDLRGFLDVTPGHVSIHAPAWGATQRAAESVRLRRVSIHVPAWGATHGAAQGRISTTRFNSRARVGRDRSGWLFSWFVQFQFTRPRGARRGPAHRAACASRFNSRARVGRDWLEPAALIHDVVSIHAPAWGATRRALAARAGDRVSIHAPAWGATRARDARTRSDGCFNSRAREGRDSCLLVSGFQSSVSIHAPAWGATRRSWASPARASGFNSRARVGRDRGDVVVVAVDLVSIHAPAWGATPRHRDKCRLHS